MSLNAEERERTSRELRQGLSALGLDRVRLARQLGWSEARVESVLAVDPASDPVDVWELRDFLVETATSRGSKPAPFTVLTPSARVRAGAWFALRRPPRCIPDI
ncbi:DUF2316 family protein [Homoserinibacter sp. YIM 151385]|uniref:DUF2316 family protein n=1 Tax=Homoserinibacter sp. YIM 151385 TaxID=2985506 RepID=UPI0022F02617|nr:DUF2316 family protein [Homoserinibacter sp. YIM 151385]WBU37758.1 DUF2316 family protein [Homoserinibacter sp. YIM 151385]